ncbi:hypothetical protein N7492_005448 [Penicillium capsulatum]|uniref:Protein BTN n=1 Tax=Penicillium capsulatum TaxID=69766 RepID=A0A9W9LRX2_9EURO|nr:hypothetical protein N7492_005448 [Penicillium capsulatum]
MSRPRDAHASHAYEASPLWMRARDRLLSAFSGADPRVCAAFWLFGLINNVLYVILLSAALDLVGPDLPKGIVLLADIVPAFVTKLVAPYFIHAVPYWVRVIIFVGLSVLGMLIVATSPSYTEGGTIDSKIVGIVLASFSAGGGELSFVGLTHFYGPFSLAAWSSGTGAAGLVGAGVYVLATTAWGFSVQSTLWASAGLPFIMALSFFVILPTSAPHVGGYRELERSEYPDDDDPEIGRREEQQGLLGVAAPWTDAHKDADVFRTYMWLDRFAANLQRLKRLFVPL